MSGEMELKAALRPFLLIGRNLPERWRQEVPLKAQSNIPGALPTVGDYRALVKAFDAFQTGRPVPTQDQREAVARIISGALQGPMSAEAVCIIPNCGKRAPAAEPFCADHRDKGPFHIRSKHGEPPCGKCHLKPDETCDICGAKSSTGGGDGR